MRTQLSYLIDQHSKGIISDTVFNNALGVMNRQEAKVPKPGSAKIRFISKLRAENVKQRFQNRVLQKYLFQNHVLRM